MENAVEKPKIGLMEWIRKERLTVKLFAYHINVDKSYIYKWSKGTHFPSEKVMKKIKKATFGAITKPEELVGD